MRLSLYILGAFAGILCVATPGLAQNVCRSAKQAPAGPLPVAPLRCVWRRVWNGHYWVRSCV